MAHDLAPTPSQSEATTKFCLWKCLTDTMYIIKEACQSHGFGLLMFIITTYVLLFVPQIANIWWKLPYRISSSASVGFWIYVPLVAGFYFGSMMVLVREGGLAVGRLAIIRGAIVILFLLFTPVAASLWGDLWGPGWFVNFTFYVVIPILGSLYFISWLFLAQSSFWKIQSKEPVAAEQDWSKAHFPLLYYMTTPMQWFNRLVLAINFAIAGFWVPKLARGAKKYPRKILYPTIAITILVAIATVTDFGNIAGELYPTSREVFGLILWPLVGLCIWLTAVIGTRRDYPTEPLDPVGSVSGNILVLLFSASVVGEFLWVAPILPFLERFFSYRLYTIWATFHTCYALVALGTLADVAHLNWKPWPVRPMTAIALVLILFVTIREVELQPQAELEGNKTWEQVLEAKNRPDLVFNWYRHVWDRMEAIEKKGAEGPFVILAASGGGSRAALFTSLVLEALSREDFPDLPKNKWSDRILLISSVSGGSLATADFVFGKDSPRPPTPFLRSSIAEELKFRFGEEYDNRVRQYYVGENIAKIKQTFAELYSDMPDNPKDADLVWMFSSESADNMCTDFMAPLLRGVITARIERGQNVSQFWHQCFSWVDSKTKLPFNNLSFEPKRPLLVFNTTDARRGNRFLLGFPQLPRRMVTMHLARLPLTTVEVRGSITAEDKDDPKYKRPIKVHKVRFKEGKNYSLELYRIERKLQPGEKRFDPYLIIEDLEGKQVLAQDDDKGGNLNAHIAEFIAPKDGDYHVLASAVGGTRGDYRLIVRQNASTSPLIAQSDAGGYNPRFPYSQTLADFGPCHQLDLHKAVRASANFPWGFQSCYLTRTSPVYNFRIETLRAKLAKHVDKILGLLPSESNLLGMKSNPNFDLEVDGKGTVDRSTVIADASRRLIELPANKDEAAERVDNLNEIVRNLEHLTIDPTVTKELRKEAKDILDAMSAFEKPTHQSDTVCLMDGGVNDNTGIPTVVEIFQHLEAVAFIEDPLVSAENKKLAIKILERLRTQGVIFLEIDSGAKPRSGVMHDLLTPLQALENANFANALADRERNLKRINKFLTPASHQRPGESKQKGIKILPNHEGENESADMKKPGTKELPWVFHHLFLCNHSKDYDVMTAWALGPDDKARLMATFFCEYQKWRANQSTSAIRDWRNARKKELSPSPDAKEYREFPSLETVGSKLRDNDRKRAYQQAEILLGQKMNMAK